VVNISLENWSDLVREIGEIKTAVGRIEERLAHVERSRGIIIKLLMITILLLGGKDVASFAGLLG